MENLIHTTQNSCTSHHLSKGIGRAECITQQNQGKLRLGSGEKSYLTEDWFAFDRGRTFHQSYWEGAGGGRIPSLSITFIFIYSQSLCPLIRILQEQKLLQILAKVAHIGREASSRNRRRQQGTNLVDFWKSFISLEKLFTFFFCSVKTK